jgi:FixJ family two-component response regulator
MRRAIGRSKNLELMDGESNSKFVAIVDDDESVRIAVQDLMQSAGVPAKAFASAEDFLNSGQQYQTACLIADVQIPGMSGLELQAKLNAQHCEIPTIFITALGDPEIRRQAVRSGAVELLSKPFSGQSLLENVCAVLKSNSPDNARSRHDIPLLLTGS